MNSSGITIITGNPSDFENLKKFFLEALESDPLAFSVTFSEYRNCDDVWWKSYLDHYLNKRNALIFLAKNEGKIVGSLGVIFETKIKKKHVASVVWFYVKSEFRGFGIGNKLIDELNKFIKTKPEIIKLSLMVTDTQTQAKKIYSKNGFLEVGKLPKDIKWNNEFHDVYIMEKLLN